MCKVCKAIVFFGALMMFNVAVASGALWEFVPDRNAKLCFEETLNAKNGADPETLSTLYCARALHDKPLGREDQSGILYNRGIIQKARGDLVAARASFEKAIRLSRTVDERNLALAEVARELGDYSVALEQYDLLAKSAFAVESENVRVALVARRDDIEDAAYLARMSSETSMPHEMIDSGGTKVAGFEKAQACTGCHGANGISVNAEFPTLAGQRADYLAHALHQYKNGQRQNAVMAGQAALIPDEDIPALANYFASLSGLESGRVK